MSILVGLGNTCVVHGIRRRTRLACANEMQTAWSCDTQSAREQARAHDAPPFMRRSYLCNNEERRRPPRITAPLPRHSNDSCSSTVMLEKEAAEHQRVRISHPGRRAGPGRHYGRRVSRDDSRPP
ncbi:hypothetical protein B5X24_HaOG212533 [Helicoverpa armigera]|uniref:Uncharacterized protein n=1 Tax=Helicoverpa armigera TaxID=29058 RepID=A0A2W1BG57_HELAM|nr:hypothetical protein B5X24_HaOG212533 [Helicoverpa armigera]